MGRSAQWYLDLAGKIFTGMGAHTRPALEKFTSEVEGLQDPDTFYMQLAYGFAPDPITPKFFWKRGPYGNPKVLKKQMAETAERGWLEVVGEHEYTLTAKGKEIVTKFFALNEEVNVGLETLPEADLLRIAELLHKVVKKAWELPEPAKKWGLSWGKKFDRGPSAPAIMQVRRQMIDLGAYREDVHLAAWRPYEVKGYIWETLTYLWREGGHSAAELAEKLESRNLDEEAYTAAFEELASRGWAAEEDGKYVVTEKGGKVRQEAEDATDRYFDAPWVALSEAEAKEVKGLLKKLAETLKVPAEESE
jgi:predicted transcriptional regulator